MPENKRVRHGDCVVFRRIPHRRDIIALFPYQFVNDRGDCVAYIWSGFLDKGSVCYFDVLTDTVKAEPHEYDALLDVLKKKGLKPRIMAKAQLWAKRFEEYLANKEAYDARCDRR